MDALGLYLSVPFCRAKCSFCNFASDAFAPGRLPSYVDRLCQEISSSRATTARLGASLPLQVDTIYFGGGTPSLLSPADIRRIFTRLKDHFDLIRHPEITVECAPNQLSPASLEEFQLHGVNRLSFGIQSFVDRESTAIGRLHTARQCLDEVERVRSAGILDISLDLIAGLPYQTASSWQSSVDQAISTGVPHISIYMLEVDDGSRLGREILAHGSRYGASAVPSDDDSADFYEIACRILEDAGVHQYEISNFARPGFRSAHNLKYWQRDSYLGLGLDAHSMLRTTTAAIRFANTDNLDAYLQSSSESDRPASPLQLLQKGDPVVDHISDAQALEETLFLGLRLSDGICLHAVRQQFGDAALDLIRPALTEAAADGLITLADERARLTPRGRVLSNEVFSRLLIPTPA